MLRIIIMMPFIMLLMISCSTIKRTDRKIDRKLKKTGLDYAILRTDFGDKTFRYISYENTNKSVPTLLFVHGAPGSVKAFLPYLSDTNVTQHYSVLIVDRLGYGDSDYGNFAPLDEQARCIAELALKQPNPKNVFLIGHSFGGPIVAHAAARLGEKLGGTIMIAPALDPENEKYFWFGKIGMWKATRWMLPKNLQVTADEKYQHAEDLKKIESELVQIKSPVLHIHGSKDKVVPFKNAAYTPTVIPSEWLTVSVWEDADHFIPFKRRAELMAEITSFIQGE